MQIKTILVANNHLKQVGGTETFTYTLIKALKKNGYEVEYFTFSKGLVSYKIEKDLKVSFKSKGRYDLVLASHNKCVDYLAKYGLIIQTCHGVFPELEQPSYYADGFVSISEEVKTHLLNLGYESKLIWNGIDCERYNIINTINKELKNVLSLSQSKVANEKIKQACDILNLNLETFDKHTNPVWDIEKKINKSDLVIGLGRSIYDSMSCGRAVLVYDQRDYSNNYADGYLTVQTIKKYIKNNCSGRYSKKSYDVHDLVAELKRYDAKDGILNREFIKSFLNINTQIKSYLDFAINTQKRHRFLLLFFVNLKTRVKLVLREFKQESVLYRNIKTKAKIFRRFRKRIIKHN